MNIFQQIYNEHKSTVWLIHGLKILELALFVNSLYSGL